jgi:uncharacterized damage-inducible protein DinB
VTLLEQEYDRLVRWDRRSNHLVFEALRSSAGQPEKALAAFQHVLETEVNWLRRIEAAPEPDPPLWIEPSLAQCETYAAEAEERLNRVAATLDDARLAATFSYRNSKGTAFTDTIADALLHMFLHGMQYRGEAAAFLNEAGHRIQDMDFIFWRRAGEPA